MKNGLTVVIGGEAGQGLATAGEILTRMLTKTGYNFLTYQGYHSRIRGGHNTFALKIGLSELTGPDDGADIVVSMNAETDNIDGPGLRPGGLLLAMKGDVNLVGVETVVVPFSELSTTREINMAALGLLTAVLGLPEELMASQIKTTFSKHDGAQKSDDPSLGPLKAGQAAFGWASANIKGQYKLKKPSAKSPRLLINGNEALALGAAAGGVNFCSFYPMTPGTSVALSLTAWAAEAGLVVEQAEDEIAAINMALGASYAGASSLVTTSGGGFALMVEGISLSGMIETPIVMVVVQRPGPATGLPTRTEQADLNLVLYAGHGEFPRAILAPSSAEECFQLGARAVWLAEASQGPVFILSDQYLADSVRPIKPLDPAALAEAVNPVEIHRRNETAYSKGQVYERFSLKTPDGRSPRLLPGFSDHLVKVDSDEHTPLGLITEDLDLRVKMQDKRLKKMEWLAGQILPPLYEGSDNPELLLVSWGSTLGAAREAYENLVQQGNQAALLHFCQIYPLKPEDWLSQLQKACRTIFIESNSTGQFAQLVRRETGFKAHRKVLRYDGLPLTAEYILKHLEVC